MDSNLLGTVIPRGNVPGENAFSAIEPILDATDGLTLSQVCAITGLNPPTIQNWVKRGWVASPVGKRYRERQVLRIIIINMLRGCFRLEQIVSVMAYINGSVEDEGDDIIPDKELYNYLCEIIEALEDIDSAKREVILGVINEKTAPYKGSTQAKEKLTHALYIMSLGYMASQIRARAEEEFQKNIKEDIS